MPKAFQDAVTITRSVGMRYLWTDSFWIIQDSPDDWARESADSDDGGCFMPLVGKDTALCRTPMLDNLMSLFVADCQRSTTTFTQKKSHHSGSSSMLEQHHVFETVRNARSPVNKASQLSRLGPAANHLVFQIPAQRAVGDPLVMSADDGLRMYTRRVCQVITVLPRPGVFFFRRLD